MNPMADSTEAELLLPSEDLSADMNFFQEIGFRLDQIFPSDDPAVARMSGHGLRIRLDRAASVSPSTINILVDKVERQELEAPNGTRICFIKKQDGVEIPKTQHRFEIRELRDNAPWVIGRAGMLYRDLIPDRLGGGIIASHIRIPEAGPVPDVVHYHTIGFQLIYCYQGWVRLVYEDQGLPFVLKAGDCVTQPPEIRHRVLEASENLEVIEIGVPAEHMTTVDHNLELPTEHYRPDREFGGQVFCHHKMEEAEWKPWRLPGFEFRETGINDSTRGVASVQVARPVANTISTGSSSHDTDILFTFVLEGAAVLEADGHGNNSIKVGDAFVIPPGLNYQLNSISDDLELLEVALPGTFNTL